VTVKPEHLAAVQTLRDEGRVLLAMGELAERLEPTQLLYGLALVQALMVRRHLHIDVKSLRGPDTAVWVLPEPTPFHSTMRI
jgi:hypothetical protein